MALFYSTRRRLGLIIDPGGDHTVEISPGVTKNKSVQEIKVKFDDHELDTEKFFGMYEAECTKRGWSVEKIDERIRTSSGFGLDYHEVLPPTPEEKEAAADALIAQANALRKEAEKLKSGKVEKKETVIEAPKEEGKVNGFRCKECGFVAKNERGLRMHLVKHLEPMGETQTKL